MKKVFVILAIFCIVSCSSESKEEIRKNAREYQCDIRPLNGMIQFFIHSTYRMPKDYQDFLNFISLWKENDSFFFEMETIEGYSIIDSLTHTDIQFAAYDDSVFFFLPKYHIGSYVIGTPRFWIEHPDAYPTIQCERTDFLPAAFQNDGNYLFDIDYVQFQKNLDSIQNGYTNRLLYPGEEVDLFFRYPRHKMIPLRVMLKYNALLKELTFCSQIPKQDSLFSVNKSINNDPTQIHLPIDELCRPYFDDVVAIMDSLSKHDTRIDQIIAICPIYF